MDGTTTDWGETALAFLDESGVTALTSDIKNLTDAAYPRQGAIADQYDSTATYAVGDYCIKDGLLYKCTTVISTAEAWNVQHWSATSAADEFGNAVYIDYNDVDLFDGFYKLSAMVNAGKIVYIVYDNRIFEFYRISSTEIMFQSVYVTQTGSSFVDKLNHEYLSWGTDMGGGHGIFETEIPQPLTHCFSLNVTNTNDVYSVDGYSMFSAALGSAFDKAQFELIYDKKRFYLGTRYVDTTVSPNIGYLVFNRVFTDSGVTKIGTFTVSGNVSSFTTWANATVAYTEEEISGNNIIVLRLLKNGSFGPLPIIPSDVLTITGATDITEICDESKTVVLANCCQLDGVEYFRLDDYVSEVWQETNYVDGSYVTTEVTRYTVTFKLISTHPNSGSATVLKKIVATGEINTNNNLADVSVTYSETPLNPLPSVTASDNGKVLQVANGEWAKGDAPGGNFVVTVTYGSQTSYQYVSDKTFEEISSAIQGGQTVFIIYNSYIYSLRNYDVNNIYFSRESVSSYTIYQYTFRVYLNNSNTVLSFTTSTMSRPTVPSPLTPSCCIRVMYDDSEEQYYVYSSTNSDISYYFDNIVCDYYLVYGDPSPYGNSDTSSETYQLVHRYVTNSPTRTGHLVFKKVVEESGVKKIKTFTVEDNEWNNYNDLQNAVVTYSEEEISGLPSGGTQGQVLTADGNGGASWSDPSAGTFVVTITGNGGMYTPTYPYTADHTVTEIYNAYASGQAVEARFVTNASGNISEAYRPTHMSSNQIYFESPGSYYSSGLGGRILSVRRFTMTGASSSSATYSEDEQAMPFVPDEWIIRLMGDGQVNPYSILTYKNGAYFADSITSDLLIGGEESAGGFKNLRLITGHVSGGYVDEGRQEYRLSDFHIKEITSSDPMWEDWMGYINVVRRVSFSFYTMAEDDGNIVAKTVKMETYLCYEDGGWVHERDVSEDNVTYYPDRVITCTEASLVGGGIPASGVSF